MALFVCALLLVVWWWRAHAYSVALCVFVEGSVMVYGRVVWLD